MTEAVVNDRAANFDIARQKIALRVKAYGENDVSRATELALAAYLDGVEPIEPTLAARDAGLMGRIETGMSRFRSLVSARAALTEVQASATENGVMFNEAEAVLGSGTDATAAYVGSLTILVREGLEALLVVVAMIALATGTAALVLIAFALLRFSARLPIGKFFSWSAGLVAVLAVVLTGKGIAALQEAGWLSAHALNTPRIDLLGIYPSIQTLVAQILMVLLVAVGFAWNRRQSKPKL